jgi:hypothetical protein
MGIGNAFLCFDCSATDDGKTHIAPSGPTVKGWKATVPCQPAIDEPAQVQDKILYFALTLTNFETGMWEDASGVPNPRNVVPLFAEDGRKCVRRPYTLGIER